MIIILHRKNNEYSTAVHLFAGDDAEEKSEELFRNLSDLAETGDWVEMKKDVAVPEGYAIVEVGIIRVVLQLLTSGNVVLTNTNFEIVRQGTVSNLLEILDK